VNRVLFAIFLPAWLPVFLPHELAAQNTSCSLAGTVQDTAGSVVPNAKVTLTGEQNGFVRTVSTTSEGFFSFPDLTPATFTLAIEAPGFKVYRETGILINADEQRSLGQLKLQVGKVTDSVTVAADAITINTANGERAGTLSGEQLEQMALRGRDIFDAVSLMPGVVDVSDGRDSPSPTSISNIYIMGGRNDSKNMTVDGVTNLDTGSNTSVHSMPSMDSVAEVKVLMSAYSAENGRNPSSINVITKGGGTQYHGQASWFFRNEDLNANNYFSNLAGRPRQEYRYNIGSYYISGPVIIPKVTRGRKNLFFFFNQEIQQQVVSYSVNEKTVPTALERQGNFSQSVNTNGTKITVNDPQNGKKAFPGNIIPPSRLNPTGQAILNMFPLPNFVDPNIATRYNWNYYIAASEPYSRRTETARIDYAVMSNWQLYLSLSNDADHQNVPYSGGNAGWVAGSLNFLLSPITYTQPGRLATLHSTNTISPTLFNEASIAVSQNTLNFSPQNPDLVNRVKLGILIPQRNPSLNPQNLIPDMTFSSIQNYANPSMSDGTPYFNQNTIYSFVDNVSKVRRSHVYKMGIYFEHTRKIQSAGPPIRGNISFNTDSNNPNDANNSYANALLGNYDSYSEALSRPQSNYLFNNVEGFIQDDWQVNRSVSISWGVRFYHDPPQYDTRGYISSFSPAAWDPAAAPVLLRPGVVNGVNVAIDPTTGTTYPQGLIGLFVPGVGNPANGQLIGGKNGVPGGIYKTAPIAIGPRLGGAWDVFGNGSTVIRGGGGIYFDRIEGNPTMNLAGNPPAVYSPTTYYGTFADIASSASSGYLAPTGMVYSLATVPHQQQVYNFNVSLDRRIKSNVFSIGYTGSLGRHLLWQRNINAVPAGADFLNINPQNKNPQNTNALSTNFLRPYSAYGDVFLYEFANNSNYNAFLTSVQHRLSRGLNLSASYTWSKALDVADAYSSSVDPFLDNRSRNYGRAGFDRGQVFTMNFYYTIPKLGKATGYRALGWFTDNWDLGGVARMLSGGPLTPGYSLVTGIGSPTGTPSDSARLQVIDPNAPLTQRFGPPPEPAGQTSLTNAPWTVASTAPQFGNLGRNTVTGPGTNNWDLSLYRMFPFREGRVKAWFRFETYNTFNHTQFNGINSTAQFDKTGAQVNTAFLLPNSARPPRYIQFALKVSF
jgi:Carboxypeptidase regulatory-like domain